MKLNGVSLPTDKQYLYYLIISQLYRDGYMEAGMRLEMSILDSTGQVLPSNRLSCLLSECLQSFSDWSDYLANRQTNALKPLTPPSPPTSLTNPLQTPLDATTRKRLHSGPATTSTSAHRSVTQGASSSTIFVPSSVFPATSSSEGIYTTTTPSPSFVPPSTNSDNGQQVVETDAIRSQLSKELEEICNAAAADVRPETASSSSSAKPPAVSLMEHSSPVKLVSQPAKQTTPQHKHQTRSKTSTRNETASNSGSSTKQVPSSTLTEPPPPYPTSLKVEPVEPTSIFKVEPVEPSCKLTMDSGLHIKIEMPELEEALDPGISSSGLLSSTPGVVERTGNGLCKPGNSHSSNIASPIVSNSSAADEAAKTLLDNLNSISNISEIGDINELTQSIVDSLVQSTSILSPDDTTKFDTSTPSSSTSPTKDLLGGDSDGSNTETSQQQLLLSSSSLPPPPVVPPSPSSSTPSSSENFQQLNLYKQNNTLLNIMGYNCSNSRNKPFRRHRTRFNDEQVAAMERYYNNVSRYARPDNGLPELIRETGLTHDTIMLWFQNKRARDKRKGWDDVGQDVKRSKTDHME